MRKKFMVFVLTVVLAFVSFGAVLDKGMKHTATADLTAAALDTNTSGSFYSDVFQPTAVFLHASVTISETVTVIFSSGTGANYDTVLKTEALSSAQDFAYFVSSEVVFKGDDAIQVTCTNANTTGSVYVTVLATELR